MNKLFRRSFVLTFAAVFVMCGFFVAEISLATAAPSQGPKNPSAAVSDSSSGHYNSWDSDWFFHTLPQAISSIDNNEAVSYINKNDIHQDSVSENLKMTGFNFSIPTGATINGIVVSITRRTASSNIAKDETVSLVAPSVTTTSKADTSVWWPTSLAAKTYGGFGDTWGRTWTTAEINNSSFGIVLSVKNYDPDHSHHVYVDGAIITVYYTLDTTPPTLHLPSNMTTEATSSAGAVVNFAATSTDVNPANPTVNCLPASGSTFPIGATTVNCGAIDAAGNTATGSFNVTVQDTTAPVISDMSDIHADASDSNGSVVDYTNPTATDAVDGSTSVNCAPPSGSTFPIGTTLVTCTSADSHSNSATKTFQIIVSDNDAPVLSLPSDITAEAMSSSGATVEYSVSASDTVDGTTPVDCTPSSGSIFALGINPVLCSSADTTDNTATGSFNVTVQDTTAPTISDLPDIIQEASDSTGAVVNFTATATDAVDGTDTVNCTPASGSTFSMGDTTVTCTSADSHSNTSSKTFKVSVKDTTVPVITLLGNATVNLTVGDSYTDAGATALDNIDGDITAKIVTVNPVDTGTAGDYTVTYDVKDAAGNSAVEVTRLVHVVAAPVTPGDGGNVGGGGGGGGSYTPPEPTLVISDINSTNITTTTLTLTWTTNFGASSYVIYAAENENHVLDMTDNSGIPPKFGYAHATDEIDTNPKTISHTVTITGLTPFTNYYFRTVSRGSLAVSGEYKVITPAVAGAQVAVQTISSPAPQIQQTQSTEAVTQPTAEVGTNPTGATVSQTNTPATANTPANNNLNPFAAGLLGAASRYFWPLLIIFIILVIGYGIYWFIKRKK